jgi:hypothetical protein
MKDVVIGSVYRLGWDHCKNWVNSLNRSGFEGHKVLCLFGNSPELVDRLVENDIQVYNFRELTPEENICAARFSVYNTVLNDLGDVENVIATDVTDVIFQHNPSNFFQFSEEKIIASSENIRYKDEKWGSKNLTLSFGEQTYDKLKDEVIYNAGVIAGSCNLIKELFFAITCMCTNRNQNIEGGGGPDQAAYNVILSLLPFKEKTLFTNHNSGWACQIGTTLDPHKNYSEFNIDPSPILENGVAVTSDGVDYFIVHQYNRNPQWKNEMDKKYAS